MPKSRIKTKKILAKLIFGVILTLTIAACLPADLTGFGVKSVYASSWWDRAQSNGLEIVGNAYGSDDPRDVRMIVVDIIRVVLGFLGILSVILVIYAGFKWMTSRGNEQTVEEAKKMLIAGVIGLVIILSAYVLANFVIIRIYGAMTGNLEP